MIRNNTTEALWKNVAETHVYQEAVLSLQMNVFRFTDGMDDDFECITQKGSPFLTQGVFVVESTKQLQANIANFLLAVHDYIQTRVWAFVTAVYDIRKGDILEYTDRSGVRRRGTIVSFHIGSQEYGDIGLRGANIRADGSVGKKEIWFGFEENAVVNLTRKDEGSSTLLKETHERSQR